MKKQNVRFTVSVSLWCRAAEKQTNGQLTEDAEVAAPEDVSSGEEQPPLGSKPVAVLFGTEYGFSKEIAEKAAARLKETEAYW